MELVADPNARVYRMGFTDGEIGGASGVSPALQAGGARPGAGRPATGRKVIFSTTAISGSAEEIALLKQKAKEASKSVSRYVLDWGAGY